MALWGGKEDQERPYQIDVWNDSDHNYIEVSRHVTFTDAVEAFDRLVMVRAVNEHQPQMRVVMRRRAHVFRYFIPERLRSPADRRE